MIISTVNEEKMTDSSDFESDAGASPSVSSDELSSSSGSSSSPALNVDTQLPPRKRQNSGNLPETTTPTTSSSGLINITTSVSLGKRPSRKRLHCLSSTDGKVDFIDSKSVISNSKPSQESEGNFNKLAVSSAVSSPRKRKRHFLAPALSETLVSTEGGGGDKLKKGTDEKARKRKRSKRRRTRSERNLLAGKTGNTTCNSTITQVATEGEEAVALDAEIDRVLEEKANKNNLSATNVKSIIRHVITDDLVQKMIMSALKKKAEAADAGESSGEDGLVGPKMTRAKTKELYEKCENKQLSLWPPVYSPAKTHNQLISETHMLIQHDLPDDSSGDEEYVPKDTDLSEIMHSEDESCSIATSDIGSPSPIRTTRHRAITRRSTQVNESAPQMDNIFKTPPPRPGIKRTQTKEESTISRRTRSKFPLKDTPLEDLERQLIPPDITMDMYDWGTETDNEDYLDFLKDFLNPGKNQNEHNDMDDDADPEYNVMEDIDDVHDREELRMDRAVKVPKKELTQLIAELLDPEFLGLGGMDIGDGDDLEALTGLTPLNSIQDVTDETLLNSSFPENQQNKNVALGNNQTNMIVPSSVIQPQIPSTKDNSSSQAGSSRETGKIQNQNCKDFNNFNSPDVNCNSQLSVTNSETTTNSVRILKTKDDNDNKPTSTATKFSRDISDSTDSIELPHLLFKEEDLKRLHHQIRQHIQLLAQSYVLTISSEDPSLKFIAKRSKAMVIEIRNFARMYGARQSNFDVCNLEPAWNIVNFWPHKFLQQSPIKKKILEEKYISESVLDENGKEGTFPRHVAKIIIENPTFVYNELLPEVYLQKNVQPKSCFSFAEDKLLVHALDQFKDMKKSTTEMAEVISSVLIVVRSADQLYNRIRNLRKTSNVNYCDESIKRYFREGILPEIDRTVPELADAAPLLQRSKEGLSSRWQSLIRAFEDSTSYTWDEKLTSTSIVYKKCTRNRKKPVQSVDENRNQIETIDRVFPNGTYQIENTDPTKEAIPLLDAHGKAGAIIYIPKYALIGATGQETTSSPLTVARCTTIVPTVAHTGRNLSPLKSKTQRTPLKIAPTIASIIHSPSPVRANHLEPPPPQQFSRIGHGVGYRIVHPIGKSVELNEISNSHLTVNTSTLPTTPKRKPTEGEPGSDGELERNSSSESGSPNVILEGTEVELSSDEDESVSDPVEICQPIEVISLSSEDEEQKQINVGKYRTDGQRNCTGGENSSSSTKADGGSTSGSSKQDNSASNSGASSSVSTVFVTQRTSSSSKPGRGDDSDDENEKRRKCSLGNHRKDEGIVKESDDNINSSEKEKDKSSKKQGQGVSVSISTSNFSGSSQQSSKGSSAASQHISSSSASNKTQPHKKTKRSPGNTQVSSRRSSKYNVPPAEKLLEDTPAEFDDVTDAFMATYLAKVQTRTEPHPGLYSTFMQTLVEAGEGPINQKELHSKVKTLFKDYPDLLSEFESFLDPVVINEQPSNMAGSSAQDERIAEIEFLQRIEKFTESCPQLKGKILSKMKCLKEKPNLTGKDIASALEQFFAGNQVMMETFKTLLPEVYRPHSSSSGMDFEEIEMEDAPRENSEDSHFEVVKLPDETTIPATATCPCVCHKKTSDPAFSSRSKHCRKCSMKDGKIYIHNGKVMRPVSVEVSSELDNVRK